MIDEFMDGMMVRELIGGQMDGWWMNMTENGDGWMNW